MFGVNFDGRFALEELTDQGGCRQHRAVPDHYVDGFESQAANLVENVEQGGVISLRLKNVFSHTTEFKINKEYEYFESEEMIYNILLSDITFSVSSPGPREMSTVDVYAAILEKRKALQEKKAAHQDTVDKSKLS